MPLYPIKGKSLLGQISGMTPEQEMQYGMAGLMPMQMPAVPAGISMSPMEASLYERMFHPQSTEELLKIIAQDRVRNAALTGNEKIIETLLNNVSDYPSIKDYIISLIGGR